MKARGGNEGKKPLRFKTKKDRKEKKRKKNTNGGLHPRGSWPFLPRGRGCPHGHNGKVG